MGDASLRIRSPKKPPRKERSRFRIDKSSFGNRYSHHQQQSSFSILRDLRGSLHYLQTFFVIVFLKRYEWLFVSVLQLLFSFIFFLVGKYHQSTASFAEVASQKDPLPFPSTKIIIIKKQPQFRRLPPIVDIFGYFFSTCECACYCAFVSVKAREHFLAPVFPDAKRRGREGNDTIHRVRKSKRQCKQPHPLKKKNKERKKIPFFSRIFHKKQNKKEIIICKYK